MASPPSDKKPPFGQKRKADKNMPAEFPVVISPAPLFPERLRDLAPAAPLAWVPVRLQPRGTAGRKSATEDEIAYKLKLTLAIHLRQWRYMLTGTGLSTRQADERLEKGVFGDKRLRLPLSYATLLDLSQREIPRAVGFERTVDFNRTSKEEGSRHKSPRTTTSPLMDWEQGFYNICNAVAKVAFYAGVIGPIRSDLGGEIQAGKTPSHPARSGQSTLERYTFGDPALQEAHTIGFLDKVIAAAHADIDPADLWLEDDGVRGIYHIAAAVGNIRLRQGRQSGPLSDRARQYLDIWLYQLQSQRQTEVEGITEEYAGRMFIIRMALGGDEPVSELAALILIARILITGEFPEQE